MPASMSFRIGLAALCILAGTVSVAEPPEHGHGDGHGHSANTPPAKTPEPKAPPAELKVPIRAPEAEKSTEPARPIKIAKAAPAKDLAEFRKADEALSMLREGNERWASGSPSNPNVATQRRQETAEGGQQPFVTVLTCADSRIPVERVFDRGVGDVFVVRVAGNIVGGAEAGTIEYGVEHLKTPLLVVMGHTKCGAVAAAASGAPLHGKIAGLVSSIKPAVERATRNNPKASADDIARLAVKENVWQSIYDLMKSSDECRERVAAGKLRVLGAVYDISTGKVEWLGEHPWQAELLDALDTRDAVATTKEADDH